MFGPQVPSVSAADVSDEAYLLDVREDDEWQAGHAPGARHVPMQDIPARLDEVPQDGDIVVVCRSGGRSGQVVGYLTANGWDNIRNLDGGMKAWKALGRALQSEDGSDPRVI